MIHRMLVPGEASYARAALVPIEDRARPLLEEVLHDPRFRASDNWPPHMGCSVFEAILKLLQSAGSDTPLREAESLAASPDAHDRQIAAKFLPITGDARYADAVARLVVDKDSLVVDRTFDGLIAAAKAGRLSPCIGMGLYDTLRSMALRTDRGPTHHAAPLMLLIDRHRATDDLLTDDALGSDVNFRISNLRALHDAGVPIRPERLLPILDSTLSEWDHLQGPDRHMAAWDASRLLSLLAAIEWSGITARAESLLDHPSDKIRDESAEILLTQAGLSPFEAALDAHRRVGWGGLTPPQQSVYAVHMLDSEVRNGGLLQYFSNPDSELVQTARAGLAAIGATDSADLLDQAIAFFGPSGVPHDRDRRNDTLAASLTQDQSSFDALDSLWYKDTDHLRAKLARYVLANPEHFRIGH
jgi:hypothetical protein